MLLGSKFHTAGDTTRWKLDYSRWLDNTATIEEVTIISPDDAVTIDQITILGREAVFFVYGGDVNQTVTVSVRMTDSLGNIKHDTIAFTIVAP